MSTQFVPPSPMQQTLHAIYLQRLYCLQAADVLDEDGLHVLAHALRFTARQEAEQGAVLCAMMNVSLPDPSPAALPEDPEELLREAIAHEDAACALIPAAIRQAQAEGLARAAQTFMHIARTENAHAQRFRRCLKSLQDGSLLHSSRRVSWFCLGCGALHHGSDAPGACEGCGRPGGYFIRSDFSPIACP